MSKDIEGRSGTTDVVRNSGIALAGHREAMRSHPGYRCGKASAPGRVQACFRNFTLVPEAALEPRVLPSALRSECGLLSPYPTPSRGRESTLVCRKSRGLMWDLSEEEASAKPVNSERAAHGCRTPRAGRMVLEGKRRAIHEPCLFFISAQSQVVTKLGSTPRQGTQASLSVAAWRLVLTPGPWPLRGDAPRCALFSHRWVR